MAIDKEALKDLAKSGKYQELIDFLSSFIEQVEGQNFERLVSGISMEYNILTNNWQHGIITQDEYGLSHAIMYDQLIAIIDGLPDKVIYDFTQGSHPLKGIITFNPDSPIDIATITAADKTLPDLSALEVTIDPGTAPKEEIEELLARISILYRKTGGEGINFTLEDIFSDQTIKS